MSDFFHGPSPRVLAHRGLFLDLGAGAVPENTLEAFARAVRIGVRYLETDVRVTADGVAVLSHDADLRRLLGRSDLIRDLTLSQLQGLDLGGGHSFLTLREALDAFPEAKFNIDVETADAVVPTVTAVLAAGATRRVLVTSFNESRRKATVRALPGVATSASASRFAVALFCAKLGLSAALRRVLRDVHAVQVPPRGFGLTVLTPRIVRMLHSAEVEVHAWTVNDPGDMKKLLALGIDGIITDRADLAEAIIAG